MKHLLITFLFITITSNSQNLKKLDINNGYKKFKFGMTKNQISNLKLDKDLNVFNQNVKYYCYTGDDIKYVGSVEIDKIMIEFYKNKLSGIQIF